MINAILDRLGYGNRSRMTNALNELSSVLGSDKRFGRSDMRSVFRSAGRSARGAALSTRSYAAAHPRQIGLGIGGAVLAAVAIYAVARMHESKKDDAVETLPRSQKDA